MPNTKESFIDKATGIPKTFVDKYNLSGGYGTCTLKNGMQFKFSKKDFDLIKTYRWRFNRGRITAYGIDCQNTVVDLKRVILADELNSYKYKNVKVSISFKNQDTLDYRRSNLVIVESSKQTFNQKKPTNNTSGVIGVNRSKHPKDKWRAYITYKKKQYNLGFYDNYNDAVVARLKAEVEFYGELAPQKNLFKQYGLNWRALIRKAKGKAKEDEKKLSKKARKNRLEEKYETQIDDYVNISEQIETVKTTFGFDCIGIEERKIEDEIRLAEEEQRLSKRYYQSIRDWTF